MKFAVIGDIHGNVYALESVLKDIYIKEVDFIISTGDLVGYFPNPNEVIALMKEFNVLVVQGNHDKYIGESDKITDEQLASMSEEERMCKSSSTFINWVLTDENRKYLKNLPKNLKLSLDNKEMIVVHGSPFDISEYMHDDDELLSSFASKIEQDIIISGHTHLPYVKNILNKTFINSGSVGKPKNGNPNSTYLLVSVEKDQINCEIQEVSYDFSQLVKDIKDNPLISDKLVDNITNGK